MFVAFPKKKIKVFFTEVAGMTISYKCRAFNTRENKKGILSLSCGVSFGIEL